MVKIVSFKICPFVQRITAMLAARNIDHGVEYISLRDKPQWFLDISPNGQVPVMITESGDALFESDAISEYIDEVYGPLEQDLSPERRAFNRAWSYQASKHYLVQCSTMQSADRDTLASREEKLGKSFARAEAQLGDKGPFFNGKTMGNVDMAWLPLLHRADIIERRSGHDFLACYPKVKRWQKALMETGLAEKAVSEDFEEAFSNFYLSDRTYLGSGRDVPRRCGAAAGGCC